MRAVLCSLVVGAVLIPFVMMGQSDDSSKPTSFPEPINSEQDLGTPAWPAEKAARGFRVPEGFHVQVFASEPDVQNPIAMAWDARGRLWVAENYTYADRIKKFDLSLRDRILIFEDADGDGRFDRRTVFTDDLQMLTSLEIGAGGVWVMTPPQLIFIPDRDGDDRPDGAGIVMLDGFTPSTDNHHTFANGLKWGPDGWLYGRCGASSPGRLGGPGTADEKRVPLFGGIWRYRPPRRVMGQSLSEQVDDGLVEVLSHGTTNPWGMDWNEHGEAFFINTVNGHLWHMIPGAHFRRPHSEDPNPHVYNTIDTHADHYHWDTGKDWTDSRNVRGEHDRLGGGHAHSGVSIYLGDNWPTQYRGRLLTLNLHGRRVNVERLEQEGCGYAGRHEPDMLQAADPWFRGLDLSYGPDGAVYILDWSDTGECHEATGVHRQSGRIYRVTYGASPVGKSERSNAGRGDLSKFEPAELVALHRHENEWFTRQARRVLSNRYNGATEDSTLSGVHAQLRTMFETEDDVSVKLRALLTLFVLEGADSELLCQLLDHVNEHVRVVAVRLLTDHWPLDTIMGRPHPEAARANEPKRVPLLSKFVQMAERDESGLVRLALASTLQRLAVEQRLELAKPLARRQSDADDHNLPLMLWYGLMPVVDRPVANAGPNVAAGPLAMARFASDVTFPVTCRLIARRLAESIDESPHAVEELLAGALKNSKLPEVLQGLTLGLAGRHRVKPPANWEVIQKEIAKADNPKLREVARDLSVLFGDGRALDEVERIALDAKAELPARRAALRTLIESRAPNRRKICEQLLPVRYLNTTAVEGLTEFDDASIGEKLAKSYRNFFPVDRPAVIDALASRPAFASSLLEQVAAGKIPRSDITVLHARQIRSFNNISLTSQLKEVWGELRDSAADKQELIARLKSQLTPQVLAQADKSNGRAIFSKTCGSCHRLYGHGGQIGPDLTGSGRRNLDYLVLNLADPSAAIGAEYRMSVVIMKDGRVLNGIVASRTERVLTLQTAKDRLTIERSEIEEEQSSTQSLMPDALIQPLTETQIRDLVGYLMHPTQVPLPANE